MKQSLLAVIVSSLFLFVLWQFVGCEPNHPGSNGSNQGTGTDQPTHEKVSKVPLRVWIVSKTDPSQILVRRWLSESEQPIDVKILTEDELLSRQDCPADLLLIPTRMIGDVVSRKWVVKLPDAIGRSQPPSTSGGETADESLDRREDASESAPRALIAATRYDGVRYGLPIGYSTIQLFGSHSTGPEALNLEGLQDRLSKIDPRPLEFDDEQVDRDALVDRFLCVAFTASQVNVKYGVLFDVRSMSARLTSDEFVLAAKLLKGLANQPNAELSVIGSHDRAWKWINETQLPAYMLVSASGLDAETRMLDSAQWISLDEPRVWYDGSSLMACVTAQCRQTAHATRFVQWLHLPETIATLQPVLPGVVTTSNQSNTLAGRANQISLQNLQANNVSCEPRMAHTHEYRKALAAELIAILRGEKDIQSGLSAAVAAWDTISGQQLEIQRLEYEKSLDIAR